jgi:hypothetical protein
MIFIWSDKVCEEIFDRSWSEKTVNDKDYIGTVVFDGQVNIFHGEVIKTRHVVTSQGTYLEEIKQVFMDSMDDFLEIYLLVRSINLSADR